MLKDKFSKYLIAGSMGVVGLVAGIAGIAAAQSATSTSAPATTSVTSQTVDTPEPGDIADTPGVAENTHGHAPFVFINSQMRDRVDMIALEKVYAEDALTLADDKLKLLGLNPDIDVTARKADDLIQVWCSVINPSKEIRERGIIAGDELLVFQSLRYTPEQLEKEIKNVSEEYRLFDIGSSFIASLIKV